MTYPIPAPRLSRIPVLALFGLVQAWSAVLPAQASTYVAYPQATTTGAWGNYGPLGGLATGGNEAKLQMLIPAAFLPSTGGKLVAIEVIATTWSAAFIANYQALDISMDHLVSPAVFPALSTTFGSNLAAPKVVLSLRNQAVSYPPGAWYQLPLTQPFIYNGRDHLVVQFQKILSATLPGDLYMVTSRDERPDLPGTVITIASGAWSATVATGTARPLRMRLVWDGAASPTNVLKSNIAAGVYWGIGTPMDLEVQGLANSIVTQFIDFGSTGLISRAPFSHPILLGNGWISIGPLLVDLPLGTMPTNGRVSIQGLPIPPDPFLVGKQLIFQAVLFEPVRGLTWSSAADVTLK